MVLSIISVFQFSRLVVVVLGSSNGGDGGSNGGRPALMTQMRSLSLLVLWQTVILLPQWLQH